MDRGFIRFGQYFQMHSTSPVCDPTKFFSSLECVRDKEEGHPDHVFCEYSHEY